MEYKLIACMHLKRQEKGFYLNEKNKDYYTFLHFINPIDIEIGGKTVKTSSNACYIYRPGETRHYEANALFLFHNFIMFRIEGESEKEFEKLVPVSTLFYTDMQQEITRVVEYMEYYNNDILPNKTAAIQRSMTSLFQSLGKEQKAGRVPSGQPIIVAIDNLRTLIYKSPKGWDVSAMAHYVHLSRAHFSVRYKKHCGVTPHEDLVCAALRLADKLMYTTDWPIFKIASECGFQSPEHFISLYKSRNGVTPGKRRRERAGSC